MNVIYLKYVNINAQLVQSSFCNLGFVDSKQIQNEKILMMMYEMNDC